MCACEGIYANLLAASDLVTGSLDDACLLSSSLVWVRSWQQFDSKCIVTV